MPNASINASCVSLGQSNQIYKQNELRSINSKFNNSHVSLINMNKVLPPLTTSKANNNVCNRALVLFAFENL